MVNWGKLIFGGVDSSEYGIYITGEAVYNAPERDVEFIEVPGRNGSIAMDKGRYKNITVTYPAGTFGKTREEFRDALSEFRNAILSQVGYQRLEDSYHPEEYRLGAYASGLEVSTVGQGQAGEFELTFECKPQRFLTIGDYPIPVDSSDYLQNPTEFETRPLLEVEGYGVILFNNRPLVITNATLGKIKLENNKDSGVITSTTWNNMMSNAVVLDETKFNDGDTITVGASRYECYYTAAKPYNLCDPSSGTGNVTPTSRVCGLYGYNPRIIVNLPEVSFTAGTEAQKTYSMWATVSQIGVDGILVIYLTATIGHRTDAYGHRYIDTSLTVNAYKDYGTTPATSAEFTSVEYSFARGKIFVNSSVLALGHPTYIDCETGDAYKYEDGKIVSVGNAVQFIDDRPKLDAGQTKITFDVSELKITPRWWRI